VVNSGTTPKNGPQNLRYRCPTSDGPLKKNGTTSAGKPDNDASTAGSQQPLSFLYRLCRQKIGLWNRMCVCSNVPNLNCGWG